MQTSGGQEVFQLCSWLRHLIYTIQVVRLPLSALAFLLYLPFQAVADYFSPRNIVVFEQNGVYHLNVTTELAASEDHVRQVLTDYIHIYRLSDSIIESKVLVSADDEKTQVETLVLCCIPVFCKEVTRVEEVSTLASGDLQTMIIPEKSDFLSGKARWEIIAKGNKTQLTYIASIEPDFFIPPLLGTQMVIDNMRKELKMTFYRIEHIARINEAREWDENFSFAGITQKENNEPCNNELITSLQ